MPGKHRLHRRFLSPVTNVRARLSLMAAVVALTVSLSAASSVATPRGVSIVFRAYQPSITTVTVGETVTWRNTTLLPHTVTALDGTFDSGKMNGGESFSVTFTKPGTFLYKCLIHPTMKGTVVVRSAQAPQVVQVRLSKQRGTRGRRTLIHVQAPRPGARVQLQARKGSGWQAVARARLSPQGTATLSVSSTSDGRLRVVVFGEPGEAPLISKVLEPTA
jgi:plastocyanin